MYPLSIKCFIASLTVLPGSNFLMQALSVSLNPHILIFLIKSLELGGIDNNSSASFTLFASADIAVESAFIRIILADGVNFVASSLLLILNLSIPSKTTSQCKRDEISSISMILLSETMIGLLVISNELTEIIPNTFEAWKINRSTSRQGIRRRTSWGRDDYTVTTIMPYLLIINS